MSRNLSTEDAYRAMFQFLADRYERAPTDELGSLLGSLDLLSDGKPADPAIETDWNEAVNKAISVNQMPSHFSEEWSRKDSEVLQKLWFSYQHIPGVAFGLNDYVQVLEGPYAGEFGSTMSLLELEPEPVFLVELASGHDAKVLQSNLCVPKP